MLTEYKKKGKVSLRMPLLNKSLCIYQRFVLEFKNSNVFTSSNFPTWYPYVRTGWCREVPRPVRKCQANNQWCHLGLNLPPRDKPVRLHWQFKDFFEMLRRGMMILADIPCHTQLEMWRSRNVEEAHVALADLCPDVPPMCNNHILEMLVRFFKLTD